MTKKVARKPSKAAAKKATKHGARARGKRATKKAAPKKAAKAKPAKKRQRKAKAPGSWLTPEQRKYLLTFHGPLPPQDATIRTAEAADTETTLLRIEDLTLWLKRAEHGLRSNTAEAPQQIRDHVSHIWHAAHGHKATSDSRAYMYLATAVELGWYASRREGFSGDAKAVSKDYLTLLRPDLALKLDAHRDGLVEAIECFGCTTNPPSPKLSKWQALVKLGVLLGLDGPRSGELRRSKRL